MHRLSSWIGEHLPINRFSKRKQAMKVAVKSAGTESIESDLVSNEGNVYKMKKQGVKIYAHKKQPEEMEKNEPRCKVDKIKNCNNHLLPSQSFSNSSSLCKKCYKHQAIRTNPWITRKCSFEEKTNEHNKQKFNTSTDVQFQSSSLYTFKINNGNNLDESISSGYGTGGQTTSPESSVHSPEWRSLSASRFSDQSLQNSVSSSDETMGVHSFLINQSACNYVQQNDLDNNHIYYELEPLNSMSMFMEDDCESSSTSSYGTDSNYTFVWPHENYKAPHQKTVDKTADNRIYAVPYQQFQIKFSRGTYCRTSELPSASRKRYLGKKPKTEMKSLPENRPECRRIRKNERLLRSNQTNASYNDSSTSDGELSSTSCDSWIRRSPNCFRTDAKPFKRNRQRIMTGEMQAKPQFNDARTRPKNPYQTDDVLASLDKQIEDLQEQSNAVRILVEQAKRRRLEQRKLCLEHIGEIRKIRGISAMSNFEMYL